MVPSLSSAAASGERRPVDQDHGDWVGSSRRRCHLPSGQEDDLAGLDLGGLVEEGG